MTELGLYLAVILAASVAIVSSLIVNFIRLNTQIRPYREATSLVARINSLNKIGIIDPEQAIRLITRLWEPTPESIIFTKNRLKEIVEEHNGRIQTKK